MTPATQSEWLILQAYKFIDRLKEIILCVDLDSWSGAQQTDLSLTTLPQKSQNKMKKHVTQGKDMELTYLQIIGER